MSGQVVLEVRDLQRDFSISAGAFKKAKLRAVTQVSLDVREGETLAIVGESGSGKSTVARMILGLLEPTAGEITLGGKPLSAYGRLERGALLQPIFQDPYASLNPRKSVGSIITLPLVINGDPEPRTRKARVLEMMQRVGLPERLYHSYPSQLSGGQRQRVAIARALINRPKIVICDEPTSALDVSVQAQILNLLQDLQEQLGLTYVFISHNLAVVQHIATRVAIMYLGQVVEEAPTQALFDDPRHPYTQALLEAVLTPDPRLGVPDPSIRGDFPNPIDPPSGCPFHPRCPHSMAICEDVDPAETRDGERRARCHLLTA